MQGSYDVPADGPDVYRSFVFPLDLPDDKWVKAVQLRPRAKTSLHHAIFFLDPTGNARRLDGSDGQAGINGMGFLAGWGGETSRGLIGGRQTRQNRTRMIGRLQDSEDGAPNRANEALASGLGGYVPGSTPNFLPDDLAMALPQGSDIVMQTHFHPSGKPEVEQAELALYLVRQTAITATRSRHGSGHVRIRGRYQDSGG